MAATILYLNTIPGDRTHEMTLAGIRRYAAARGWDAEIAWTDASSGDHHILASFDNSSYGSGVSRRCDPISAIFFANYLQGFLGAGDNAKYFGAAGYVTNRKYRVETSFGTTGQTLTIDDTSPVTFSNTFSQVESGKTLYLFAAGHSSEAAGMKYPTKARVYSMKIYQNGSLVRDYVPVIADNGGPYLFDRVTKTFHQGTTSGFWDVGEIGDEFSPPFTIIIR